MGLRGRPGRRGTGATPIDIVLKLGYDLSGFRVAGSQPGSSLAIEYPARGTNGTDPGTGFFLFSCTCGDGNRCGCRCEVHGRGRLRGGGVGSAEVERIVLLLRQID